MNGTYANENFPDLFEIGNYGEKRFPAYIISYIAIYSLSSIIGTCGHITIIVVTLLCPRLRNVRNAFLISLSSADLIVSSVVMPASIIGVVYGQHWHVEKSGYCYITSIICAPACIASIYSIAFVAISRYYYIVKYASYLQYFTAKKIYTYIFTIWLFALSIHLPNHFGWGRIHYTYILRYCSFDADLFSYAAFYASILATAMIIAFVFYLKIYLIVRKSRLPKSLIVGKRENANKKASIENISKNDDNAKTTLGDELKLIKATFKILLLFVICWSPASVLLLLSDEHNRFPPWAYLYAAMLSHCNSTFNFSVYFAGNDLFRRAIRESCRCCLRKFSAKNDKCKKYNYEHIPTTDGSVVALHQQASRTASPLRRSLI